MFAVLAARAALISFITTTLFLAPSVGNLAIQGGDWSARFVMLGLLVGVWCSFFGYAAARERLRRIEADDAVLTAAHERLKVAARDGGDVRLRAVFAPANP